MRLILPFLLFGLLASATATYFTSFAYFRAEDLSQARSRLNLYRSTVEAELQRFVHLPFVLANDPIVIQTAAGAETDVLNARLAAFADRAEIDAIYLMDLQGQTIAASNAGTARSFVGQNYAFRPYFQDAVTGAQGAFYGIGATTGIPGYFYANQVVTANGVPVGVVAIKIDLSALQTSWQDAGERVILANTDGVALLASRPEWRYRTLEHLSDAQRADIAQVRQFAAQPLTPLDWTRHGPTRATIDQERMLHLQADDLPNDWSLHYFASEDPAKARAWTVTSAVIGLAGLVVIAFQILRTRRIRAALATSEIEEIALRAANEQLAREVEDRRVAESRLKKTQQDLERAGRLAALGQLASSVTHELGQPIAAMRNQLAAAEMRADQTPLTEKLNGLVDRMEGITRQLKFFSRKGRDKFETLDLRDVMRSAVDLVAPNLEGSGVDFTLSVPDTPVRLSANRLRIEQVMTNLLRNAFDAIEEQDQGRIAFNLGGDDDAIWFEVADNGHGLGEHSFADLSEPFTTTRDSGKGMGLGLTISAGIVDDHEGTMTASPNKGGGAVFRATFKHPPKGIPRE